MSDNLAYYLKYRPQTLSELVGQEFVKKTLFSSIQNSKLSHAYIFVGPRGTGKTSTARILAKMVNCESQESEVPPKARLAKGGKNQESSEEDSRPSTLVTGEYPCNKCPTCVSITDGSNLDLIEIDAASNRGIEDIRSLRDKIKLAPSGARKKIYIIDEVHMLTTEAFNALLKTLEEPPSHALFILATTDPGKIPQTIFSRTQRLDFKLATTEELSEALARIVKEEKIDVDEEALKLLVKKAEGSFRDGVKLLDQVSSLDKKITFELLEKSLKSTSSAGVLELIKAFSKKDASEGLTVLLRQEEYGVDIKELIISLMETLRNVVFIKNGLGEQLVKSQFSEDKYKDLVEVSGSFSGQDLVRDLGILQDAFEKLKFASIPSLPLELAVVEICGLVSIQSEPAESAETPMLRPTETQIIDDLRSEDSIPEAASAADNTDIVKLKEKWTFVLETIRASNFSLEALLRVIRITECTEDSVIMEVPYAFHQRILEAPKNRELLEGVFSDVLGRSIRISTVLGARPQRQEDVANIEVAQDDEIIRAAAEIFNSDTVN